MFSQRPEDQYIEQILLRRAPRQIYQGSLDTLLQVTRQWAGQYVLGISFSGSFAKGTAVAGSSDIDLFVSLRNDVLTGNTPTLQSLYTSLNAWLSQSRYVTRLQNVSIGVTHGAFQVDVVPAVKHLGNTSDHSLHRRKTGTWTKTNVDVHINHIRYSGRTADIKAAKIWRNLHGLDISSFYLELAVLE